MKTTTRVIFSVSFALVALSIILWFSASGLFGLPIDGGLEQKAEATTRQLQSQATELEQLATKAHNRYTGHDRAGAPQDDNQWAAWHDVADEQANNYHELAQLTRRQLAEQQNIAETARIRRAENFAIVRRTSCIAFATAVAAFLLAGVLRLSNASYAQP
jgi:hypothetical protein